MQVKENIHVLLFYKFVNLDRLEALQKKHLRFMKDLDVRGRVIIGEEGINGSVSGTEWQVEEYKSWLISDERFSDIRFKEEIGLEHPFRRNSVLIKEEIVALGKKVDFENKAPYITSKELKEFYDRGLGKNIIILDARNDYEYKIGHFNNSIHLNIKTFNEFPEALNKIENLKDKKIITVCTGGIRCEKAAPYMKSQGFKNVLQLKDGILNFGKEYPDTYWEGKCFVFDKRLVSDVNNSNDKPLTNCETCEEFSDLYRNCRNVDCNDLYTQCVKCQEDFNGCCSKDCFKEFKKQCLAKSVENQGRRMITN